MEKLKLLRIRRLLICAYKYMHYIWYFFIESSPPFPLLFLSICWVSWKRVFFHLLFSSSTPSLSVIFLAFFAFLLLLLLLKKKKKRCFMRLLAPLLAKMTGRRSVELLCWWRRTFWILMTSALRFWTGFMSWWGREFLCSSSVLLMVILVRVFPSFFIYWLLGYWSWRRGEW